MRFARIQHDRRTGIAVSRDDKIHALFASDGKDLDDWLGAEVDTLRRLEAQCLGGEVLDQSDVQFLTPVARPTKIICVGLNYREHSEECGFVPPTFPTLFGRFTSSLIGHGAPLIKPTVSDEFDYEGELVAVIGRGGRHISRDDALDHVMGYSVFNDGSVRDYQTKTPQWTAGKNFDGTGAFGPWLVTADELPKGAAGLSIETRVNGVVVQSASTSDMIFDVADLVSIMSSFMTLEVGDVIVSGTPSGVGMARTPPLFLKDGDVCDVSVEQIGVLRNPVVEAG